MIVRHPPPERARRRDRIRGRPELVTPIASLFGATYSVGTRMVVADGRYTGEIEFYCYGANKAAAIRELSKQHGYRLDDSATECPPIARYA